LLRKDRSVDGQMLSRTSKVDGTTVNSSKLGEELNMLPGSCMIYSLKVVEGGVSERPMSRTQRSKKKTHERNAPRLSTKGTAV
jgi:hypothetical protein